MRFPGGPLAQFSVSQAASAVSSFRLVGTRGDVRVDAAFSYTQERRCVVTAGDDIEDIVRPAVEPPPLFDAPPPTAG